MFRTVNDSSREYLSSSGGGGVVVDGKRAVNGGLRNDGGWCLLKAGTCEDSPCKSSGQQSCLQAPVKCAMSQHL